MRMLAPMVELVRSNLNRRPRQVSADFGYCSETNLSFLERKRVDAYIATGKETHRGVDTTSVSTRGVKNRPPGSYRAKMNDKLKCGGFESPYRLRKQTVEPVFGNIKEARGFRRFHLRGLGKVGGEWSLVCLVHNLMKLYGAKGGPRG